MAIAEYYVAYSTGNDTTGDGTSGTPWATIQKALDTINHSGNGARINVKAGETQILAAVLNSTTYHSTNGAGAASEPLIIQGYTSSAGDGGIGTCEGTTNSCAFWGGTGSQDADYVVFRDLSITTGNASGFAITIDNQATFSNVTLVSPHGGIDIDQGSICDCSISYVDNYGILGAFNSVAACGNLLTQTSGTLVPAVSGCSPVSGNIINVRAASEANFGVIASATGAGPNVIESNTILANITSGANTNHGIRAYLPNCLIRNNYIEGFGGTNGKAIDVSSASVGTVLRNNAFYANTTQVADAGLATVNTGVITCSASGVVSASGGDYTPTSELIDAGYPTSLGGTSTYNTVGAITTEHAGGGGGFIANTNQVAG